VQLLVKTSGCVGSWDSAGVASGEGDAEFNPNAEVLTTEFTDEHRYQNVAGF
jgi:hypothetical protein